MSDETSTATADTATDTLEQPATAPEELGDAGKKALEAERKARRAAEKAAAEAAAKIRQYEDAQKSEAERLAARVAELEQAAATATAEAARQRIVNETGLPADLADLIVGADEDAMRATAERIKAHLAPAQRFGPVDTGPKNVDNGLPKQLTRTDLAGMSAAQIEQAREAGQLADLMAGKR